MLIHHELGQRALAIALAERAVAVADPGVVTRRIVLAATLGDDDPARATLAEAIARTSGVHRERLLDIQRSWQ